MALLKKHIRDPRKPWVPLCGAPHTDMDLLPKVASRLTYPYRGVCPECVTVGYGVVFGVKKFDIG